MTSWQNRHGVRNFVGNLAIVIRVTNGSALSHLRVRRWLTWMWLSVWRRLFWIGLPFLAGAWVPVEALPPHAGWFLVFVEVALQRKCLSTSTADVGFFVGMGLDVSTEIWLIGECLGTDWTLERLLSCVRPNVTLQKPRSAETLTAEWALAALVMGAHVHTVCWHGDVYLLAVWAFPRLLVAEASMRLAMTCKVAGRTVSFATHSTDVWLSRTGICVLCIAGTLSIVLGNDFIDLDRPGCVSHSFTSVVPWPFSVTWRGILLFIGLWHGYPGSAGSEFQWSSLFVWLLNMADDWCVVEFPGLLSSCLES
jgi:hypothetical protein